MNDLKRNLSEAGQFRELLKDELRKKIQLFISYSETIEKAISEKQDRFDIYDYFTFSETLEDCIKSMHVFLNGVNGKECNSGMEDLEDSLNKMTVQEEDENVESDI